MTLKHTIDDALPLEACSVIEQAMARQKPFGDDSYILGQLQHCLSERLERIAPNLPPARELLDAVAQSGVRDLHRLFAEPTLRSAIVHAHEQIVSGIPYGQQNEGGLRLVDCSAVFTAAARYVQEGGADTPLEDGSLVPLGPEPHHGWIWRDEHPNDTYGSIFREVVMQRYGTLPCTPSAGSIEMLTTGCRLLHDLLPSLTPSALHHAQIIAVVPPAGRFIGVASGSQFHLGGVIFLRESPVSPWWVAEHLLHESLHHKLYDFRHGHSLIQLNDMVDQERPVVTPWNSSRLSGANRWNTTRTLAAFHVYVHLALLATVAEHRAPELEEAYGPLSDMLESHRARARARYLGQKLQALCWNELGAAGHALADWLHSLLDILDPAPAPAGSTVHLYLDRYRNETQQLEDNRAESPDRWASVRQSRALLVQEDIASTRVILHDLDARGELQRLDASVARFTEQELGDSYPEIRRTIEACLTEASLDGWRMSESGRCDAQVGDMVDRASDSLFALRTRIPAAVAEAKRRAVDQHFTKSCADDVGRFLAVMAAHLPPAAKVLEIGTGTGVGTAWIVSGLGARTDVDVRSVEINEQLSAVAQAYDWPSYVQLENADAKTVLREFGMFDLVFSDAFPFKVDNLGLVVDVLRPGGMLILDDMSQASVGHPSDMSISTLRQELLNHPGLVAVDIEWSSGLVIATKRPYP
ncbi:O-methyltransferase family protein [Mycobacterium europaeum]|uniref:O-methyltransferase family protein n=1 Tax=Mycobacterium europaeum TaxID=761804 RepID=A0A0U1DT87_9MYCO|nr:class I SAM-dependent methyltransferase [Mycobacterium europaeum]CQD22323.1 O-methyltransferase family protein [Mycobacterium europaeum]